MNRLVNDTDNNINNIYLTRLSAHFMRKNKQLLNNGRKKKEKKNECAIVVFSTLRLVGGRL